MGDAISEGRPGAAAPGAPAIELRGISKAFGPVQANRDISIRVLPGTIHGIIGENGAGKSTLMSILYGFYRADAGEILIGGRPVQIGSSRDAIAAGIGMVFQHFKLVQNFTVLENVVLGAEEGALLRPSLSRARRLLTDLARDYELEVDPDAVVEEIGVGLQQRVEILKALYRKAEILILDEPTGVLTPAEADHLFRILRGLKAQGKTIILITHKLREIMDVTDRVSVMRRGEMVATRETAETSPEELAELMVGRKVLLHVPKAPARPGRPVLEVEDLRVVDDKGVERLKGVGLQVRAGEILGIAGVAGNGQSELLEVLGGIVPGTGRVRLNGADLPLSGPGADGQARRAAGISHVPEDRQTLGLILDFMAWENVAFGYHHDPAYQRGALLMNNDAIRADARGKIERFDIRPANPMLPARNFSGGNQQKIVCAREIERSPDLLLVGQPTRGVDIGAIEFIHRRLVELRDAGKAILLVSVELDEILSLADRIAVMFDGRIMGERLPGQTNPGELGLLMAGVAGREARVMRRLPPWADALLVPLISLVIAFALSALVIRAIGEDPWEAMRIMVDGALGSTYAWGYTLYYATNFMFTGLAVAVAFHAGLFNIGGEGQATLGGLGVALACLSLPWPHWSVALAAAMASAMLFGAAWALLPAWLQARRGSHIVITTIMFNFIGAALLNYVLVNVLKPAGSMDPASARFPETTVLPRLHEILGVFGIPFSPRTPANISLLVAILACVLVWALIWRTRLGYEIRAFGKSQPAARYAGISPVRITLYAMLISGALAGLMAVNNVMGEAQRLVLNAVEGAGFIGIAVALMGRSHPFGVFLAALLFGFLYQGGAELALWTSIPRELIVVIQALVILFTGALDNMVRMPVERLYALLRPRER